MIFGIGHDIIEVERIKKAMDGGDRFKKRIFTNEEINFCLLKADSLLSFAVRFAAKEAFLKALGTGLTNGIKWTDIEILNDSKGKPYINLYGKAKEKTVNLDSYVSLSHLKSIVSAIVILEEK